MENNKIKVIFQGKINRKIYYMRSCKYNYNNEFYDKPYINEAEEFACYKNFYECEIENPSFEKDEKIYINELDLKVIITNKIRSIDGVYIYETTHVTEVIEDEETEESKNKAEEELAEEMIKYNKWINETNSKLSKKKWFQFWK